MAWIMVDHNGFITENGWIYSINMMVTVLKKLSNFCTPVREKIGCNTKTHKGIS